MAVVTLEAAVEALARAMPGASWCVDEDGDPEPQFDMGAGDLLFWPMSSWPNHKLREGGRALVQVWGPPPLAEHILDAREAMLVLRCALLGTTRVRCPDCEGAKVQSATYAELTGRYESMADVLLANWKLEDDGNPGRWSRPCPTCTGPAVECEGCRGSGSMFSDERDPHLYSALAVAVLRSKPCPACKGESPQPGAPTGHVDRPWAEVLIGAMPRECGACSEGVRSQTNPRTGDVDDFECIDCEDGTLPGDPEARTLLTQLSDQLQLASMAGLDLDSPAHAAELGVWLALYLGQQPCGGCVEGKWYRQGKYGVYGFYEHEDCAGSGLALGAHDRAMAEAAEQLAVGLEQAEAAE